MKGETSSGVMSPAVMSSYVVVQKLRKSRLCSSETHRVQLCLDYRCAQRGQRAFHLCVTKIKGKQ